MKIIIVDDEPKIRNGLSKLLAKEKEFEIAAVFSDAQETLEQISLLDFDVIITDIKMPEMNGLELIERLQTVNDQVKIIILSGYSDFTFAQRAIELGVYRYLTKPTDRRQLISVLHEIEDDLKKEKPASVEAALCSLRIQKVLDYIQLNYPEKIGLSKLAKEFYFSPSYLSERFKKETGKTVTEYITSVRLEKAKELLVAPEYKIAEIAEMVGFQDPRHFSTLFKKQFDITPNDFRNKT